MHRQGYDVQLTQHDERGWRATFYVTGMEHSATTASASAWEPTPWLAVNVQRSPCSLPATPSNMHFLFPISSSMAPSVNYAGGRDARRR